MPQNDTPALTLLTQRIAAINAEIEMIFADAERRSGPLRSKLQRLQIAEEELRELDPDQAPLPLAALPQQAAPASDGKPIMRRPVKSLVEEELRASALPLSKAELLERFIVNGHTVQETTLGSTLSRLVADGFLSKEANNRYRLSDAAPAASKDHSTREQEEL